MAGNLSAMEGYLNSVRIPLRLSCTTESGWPVALSLWYTYQEDHLYCATQKTARVISYLKNDPRCAFEIAADLPPYCGVRGQAIADINEQIGLSVLERLLLRYLGDLHNNFAEKLMARSDTEVAIVLKPVNCFSWDFSNRMKDVVNPMLDLADKVCP
jgi:hypothetical protein